MKKAVERVTKWFQEGVDSFRQPHLFAGISFERIILYVLVGVIGLALVSDVFGAGKAWVEAEKANERAETISIVINRGIIARYVKFRAEKDSLQGVVEAADKLNGELIAALAIHTKPDTVIVYRAAAPTSFEEMLGIGIQRTASLTDTTDMGIEVTFSALAPANQNEPLQLGYQVMVPSFRPEIGFVQTEQGVVATVSWANQEFDVEAPFFQRPPALGGRDRLELVAGGAVGALLNPFEDIPLFVHAYASLNLSVGSKWQIQAPVGITNMGPYAAIGIEKKLFGLKSFRSLLPF